MIPGLVSVTLRSLPVGEIIALVGKAGLCCIEWGGDVHVPHGNLAVARETAQRMKDTGLRTACYGSYYRAGEERVSFGAVLETAVALGSPKIRIWAGTRNAEETSPEEWQRIADDIRRVTEQAAGEGITVVLEFHQNTLTNTAAAARRLLKALQPAGTGLIWQANSRLAVEENLAELAEVQPWVHHVHCGYSAPPLLQRSPLAEGRTVWRRYLEYLRAIPSAREILLEFVRGHSPEQVLEDARELVCLCKEAVQVNP